MSKQNVGNIVATTQAYYDGPADEIYRTIWGDNLHLGVPAVTIAQHPEAMEHTNAIMAEAIALNPHSRVIDLGCGYGSTARYLAANYGCHVTEPTSARKNWNWPAPAARSRPGSAAVLRVRRLPACLTG